MRYAFQYQETSGKCNEWELDEARNKKEDQRCRILIVKIIVHRCQEKQWEEGHVVEIKQIHTGQWEIDQVR
ncbi:hypothetical protein GCM10007108_13300 [Thermogymnomonas acidicola]|uniref:Uncharacterized protein n=1 Tax=Thermogymnomonas acidicola TaxID=399579 RepID=A0AA37BS63_9ARCH|nr:hypothetical protein GCM10007108_13300 [Thermogymnomonas acidicola]